MKARKHSKKRDEILRILRETNAHPSALWVYDKLRYTIPDLSLGTVYRNLSLFREEGSVIRVAVVDGEERFDAWTAPHPHLICVKCNRVYDFPEPGEAMLKWVADNSPGYDIDFRRTLFYGICADCKNMAREDPELC
ncbi:MAG: transcriptional repressor [Spirochaetaceae bacterium]|jgi:Fur family peroxide stress response transcriptional regulator|nr:transcriptional repressor [Spirochaetaceae bacterium]